MQKIFDDFWIWPTIESERIISLKEEIDKKYSLLKVPNTTLYHYTDASGLKGIINSESLWLTNINYMNDADELSYSQNLIRNIIKEFENKHTAYNTFFKELHRLSDPFENRYDIYISSFCEEGQLLSQWKNYGLYSIGFDTTKEIRVNPSTLALQRFGPTTWQKVTLRKVIYNKDKQINTIKDILEGIFKLFKEKLSRDDKKNETVINEYARLFANFIRKYVLCFKDEVFKEEKEWRFIHIQGNRSNEKVNFRSVGEYLIPYIEGQLKTIDEEKYSKHIQELINKNWGIKTTEHINYVEKNGSFPIKEVIIGPDPHHKIAESSAKKFLIKKGFSNCDVFSKSTNLRKGW